MAAPIDIRMGSNVFTATAGLKFSDGTSQLTASIAPIAPQGSNSISLTGVTSGQATIKVADIAGTPSALQLPLSTGTPGQLLTTDGGTPQQLSWTTPAGGSVTKAQRVHVGVIASATPSAITTLTWASPFADNNYTVTASVEIAETPPNGAATEIITVGSFKKSAAGAGLTFVVCNASSGVHDVTVNFIAIHD